MSQLLPGKYLTLPMRAIGVLALVTLFCFSKANAVAEDEKLSGVVVPKNVNLKAASFKTFPTVEEFTLPTKYSGPYGIAIDKRDRIWVTLMAANSLGVFDPATGDYKEYRIPSTKDLPEVDWKYDSTNRTMPEETVTNYSVGNPGSVIIAPDGLVWFVMLLGNSIVRFDPEKEEFTEFIIPTPNAQPYDLAADGTGRIWFVEKNGGAFGFVDTNKETIAEISLGAGANLAGISIDKEGNVWISDANNNYIGRYRPAEKGFMSYQIITPQSQPGMIRFDSSGMLWFCQLRTRQLGVFMPDPGIFSVVDIPGYNATPQSLAFDDKKRVWFVDSMMNRIGFFESDELNLRMFNIATANSQPMDVEIDSKGDVWFTQNDRNANKIARLLVETIPAEEMPDKVMAPKPGEGSGMTNRLVFVVIILVVVALLFTFFRRGRK